MRILICDDDPLILDQLRQYVNSYFEQCHCKCPEIVCFSDGASLLADKKKKDILFLDIEMPGVNGIYVGNELKKENKDIIIFIVTSHSEYLDEAMRFQVFRYLSKPLDKQRFFRNMKDAVHLYHTRTVKLPVETKDDVYTVSASEIVAVEASNRKVLVYTTQKVYPSIHNMQYWLERLPDNCFFQTHRSFIVNFQHVKDFSHNIIHLTNAQCNAYLTRRKYREFRDAYLLYLENTR